MEVSKGVILCRASDKCQKEKRKTINGDDLLWAMATLGFEDYIDPLKAYLARYREVIDIIIVNFNILFEYVLVRQLCFFFETIYFVVQRTSHSVCLVNTSVVNLCSWYYSYLIALLLY